MIQGVHSLIQRYEYVRQFPIFSKLKWIDKQRIALKSSVVSYSKGDMNPPAGGQRGCPLLSDLRPGAVLFAG